MSCYSPSNIFRGTSLAWIAGWNILAWGGEAQLKTTIITKNMLNKWVECVLSASQQGSISLTCHPAMLPLRKTASLRSKMEFFDSPRLNQEFGSSSLKKTREAFKIWVILDGGILKEILLWAFKLFQGLWKPSILHNPQDRAWSQYVKVAEIKKLYSFLGLRIIYLPFPQGQWGQSTNKSYG